MLNFFELSKDELAKSIRDEQEARVEKNKQQIHDYIMKTTSLCCNGKCEYQYEDEVYFMIKNSVSLKFITSYLNVSEQHVKDIAIKYKLQSNLLSSFSENVNARCFSRNQILISSVEFNYLCPMCFKPLDITDINSLTGHHIQPFARGGKTSKDNCLPLHVNCHLSDFKLLHSVLFDSDDLCLIRISEPTRHLRRS